MAAVEASDGGQEVVAIGAVSEVGCSASLFPSWRRPLPVVRPDRMLRAGLCFYSVAGPGLLSVAQYCSILLLLEEKEKYTYKMEKNN
jgi:hypothetical protein